MAPISNRTIVGLLEKERKKFEDENYSPEPTLLRRCRFSCQLVKLKSSHLGDKPRQTRERQSNARDVLVPILEKSAEVFILVSLHAPASNIGSSRQYGLVPMVMAWWEEAIHPPKLRDFAQDICTRFGLPCRLSEELPAPSSFSSTTPHSSPENTEDTDIEARNQDVAAESSGEVKVQQVSNEQSSCLFNPINELRVVPSSSDNSGMSAFPMTVLLWIDASRPAPIATRPSTWQRLESHLKR
jgi:hypothetical protein